MENVPRVPRSLAPNAPNDSLFPSVPFREHEWYCVKDARRYECSCGLWEERLARGDFVLYNASMCQVNHPKKGLHLVPALTDFETFMKMLVAKTARINMVRFNKEEDG